MVHELNLRLGFSDIPKVAFYLYQQIGNERKHDNSRSRALYLLARGTNDILYVSLALSLLNLLIDMLY